jgi:hypothetical protein
MKATDTITALEGYDAMRVFLEAVSGHHGMNDEEIEFTIGSSKIPFLTTEFRGGTGQPTLGTAGFEQRPNLLRIQSKRFELSAHSAGASRSRSTPMPRGKRPSTAALMRSGARNASEMVILT